MPEPRSPIPLARRLEAATERHRIFSQAAAAYERDGMLEQSLRASDVAATWWARICELEAEKGDDDGTGT